MVESLSLNFRVCTVKLVGVRKFRNYTVSFNDNVDITAKKATTSLNFLKRNYHICPSTVKEKCYKSLVRPIMEYASPTPNAT